MKKTRYMVGLFVSACLMFSLAACGSNVPSSPSSENNTSVQESSAAANTETPAENAEPEAGADILVAYFSATGNTKAVAEQIAELTGGDLYEITPTEPYTEKDLNYGNNQSRTSLEMDDPDARPEIGSEEIAMDEYATLYLGYPKMEQGYICV